jgi:hypothetical protein
MMGREDELFDDLLKDDKDDGVFNSTGQRLQVIAQPIFTADHTHGWFWSRKIHPWKS